MVRLKSEKGVTMVEIVIALAILGVVISGVIGFFTNSFKFQTRSQDLVVAQKEAEEIMEELKNNNGNYADIRISGEHKGSISDEEIDGYKVDVSWEAPEKFSIVKADNSADTEIISGTGITSYMYTVTVTVKKNDSITATLTSTVKVIDSNGENVIVLSYNKNTEDDVVGIPVSQYKLLNERESEVDFVVASGDGIIRTGYEFAGWNDEDGNKVEANSTIKISENTTLHAQWKNLLCQCNDGKDAEEGKQYCEDCGRKICDWCGRCSIHEHSPHKVIVHLDANKGKLTSENGQKVEELDVYVTYGEKYNNLPEAEREGYTFEGWYTSKEGTERIDENVTVNTIAKNGEKQDLYAHWTAEEYDITFDANGGTLPSETSKEVTYDSTYGDLPTPTRPGYDFDGWYTEGNDKVTPSSTVEIAEDHKLTAEWKANKYTVRLDANGGIVSPETIEVTYDKTYELLPTPTRPGYHFDGWYTEGNDKVTKDTSVTITSNQTLYAHWSLVELAKNSTWFREEFGIKPSEITEIKIVDNYTGSSNKHWEADEGYRGAINCYVDGTILTIAGNGSGAIYANKDSSNMFKDFTNVTSINNIEFINTTNVTDMSRMFENCSSLGSLDLRDFNTTGVPNSNMFDGMNKLAEITLGKDFKFNDGCTLQEPSSEFIENATGYWYKDDVIYKPEEDVRTDITTYTATANPAMLLAGTEWLNGKTVNGIKTVNIVNDPKKYTLNGGTTWNADVDRRGAIKCYIDGSTLTIVGNATGIIYTNENSSYMFGNYTNAKKENIGNNFGSLEEINGLNVLDTSKTTNMSYMFSNCNNVGTLDVSGFDTSKVTGMGFMFAQCNNVGELDVSNFGPRDSKEPKLEYMNSMFQGCEKVKKLDLGNLDTSKIWNMGHVFDGCRDLKDLIIGDNFKTDSVTQMQYMFRGCSSLTKLDLSNFDTSDVTDMNEMFSGCSGLTSLNLSNFNTSNVTDMYGMFSGCSGLKSLVLIEEFNTSLEEGFNTSKVTNMSLMFNDCSSLTELDLRTFDTTNVVEYEKNGLITSGMKNMFNGNSNLKKITLGPNFIFKGSNCYNFAAELPGKNWYEVDENGNALGAELGNQPEEGTEGTERQKVTTYERVNRQ